MWPFKKSKPVEKEKAFLITEEAQKQNMKEHIILELLCKHMEENRYGDWTISRRWMEAIQKGVEESFDDSWEQTLANLTTVDFDKQYSIYVTQKR